MVIQWPGSPTVKIAISQRLGGYSQKHYATMNLGDHVGDDIGSVRRNRQLFAQKIGLPSSTQWVSQVHGAQVVRVTEHTLQAQPEGDAIFLHQDDTAGVILTADCLSVVICDHVGREAAVIHGGWRGLAQGILAAAVANFSNSQHLRAFLGPCIKPQSYVVGAAVRDTFVEQMPTLADAFWPVSGQGCAEKQWHAWLTRIAFLQLRCLGVKYCFGYGIDRSWSTKNYYSYRQQSVTGRFATAVILQKPEPL